MAWRQGLAYSQDLRDRVLAAVDRGGAVRAVAPFIQVSISYIYKALERRDATGETTARPGRGIRSRKLAAHETALSAEVLARPDATLAELRAWLLETRGVAVSVGCLWNTLDRLGLTFKKKPSGRRSRTVPTSPPPAKPGAPPSPV